jgi:DNA-binding transcriptional LysR family regulator
VIEMNLASFDLNLLVAFDALMEERNVTRAGQKIGLSQPAMSAVLKRLREVTQDDLFERSGDGMRPTARAVELAKPIRQALQQIQTTLDPWPFDPVRAKRTFRIATNDLGAALIMPPLCERLKSWSDDINFEFLYVEGDRAIELLQSGAADVAVGPYSSKYDQLHSELLYKAPFACALRNDHPLANQPMGLEAFAGTPQIVVSQRGDPSPVIDQMLAKAGLKRRIAFTIPHYLAVPFLLARTDLIAVIPTKLIERFGATERIRTADAPFASLTVETTLLWTHGVDKNLANFWLRRELINIVRDYELDHWR